MDSTGADLIKFLGLVGRIKHLPRTGWVLCNIKNPETVAGHMYRMAMMTFLLGENDPLNRYRCMEMALVHDLAESIIGDITPRCGVSAEEKQKREMEAMMTISNLMGKPGAHLYSLFLEYEEQKTPEAKFIKELDLFDMALQAFEYEQTEESPKMLQEFFDSTANKFSHPLVLKLVSQVHSSRESFGDS